MTLFAPMKRKLNDVADDTASSAIDLPPSQSNTDPIIASTNGQPSSLPERDADAAAVLLSLPQSNQYGLSRSQTPLPLPLVRTNRPLHQDASLVLIGMRGVGKSTLGVIASSIMKWRLIDEERHFTVTTGHSSHSYVRTYGSTQYRRKESELLRSILAENRTNCVIACSSGCIESECSRKLLRDYAETHPVVHIMRGTKDLGEYLGESWSEKLPQLQGSREPMYRMCSNFDFFNMTDGRLPSESNTYAEKLRLFSAHAMTPVSLTLKNLERDFERFLRLVYHIRPSPTVGKVSGEEYVLPAPEYRTHSYVLPIALPSLTNTNPNLAELESCVDVLEFRVDHLLDPTSNDARGLPTWRFIGEQFAFLRRKACAPIIYHVGDRINGRFNSDEDYFDLLYQGLRLGAEYVKVQIGVNDDLTRKMVAESGSTRVVGYYHYVKTANSRAWESDKLFNMYLRGGQVGCHIAQITQPATAVEDNFLVERFHHRVSQLPEPKPLISVFNTGKLGRTSQCFNKTLTPVFNSSLDSNIELEQESEITVHQAQAALFEAFVYDKLQFYTIGTNIAYSLAPALHNAAFQAYGMPHKYFRRQNPSSAEVDDLLRSPNFGGTGLSLPWKRDLLPKMDALSVHARAIGAINTVLPIRMRRAIAQPLDATEVLSFEISDQQNRAGPVVALYGDNTDWLGIRTVILRYLSPANSINSQTCALILGAGGMARAAVYAMIKSDIRKIFVYNRTRHNATALVDHFQTQGLTFCPKIEILDSLSNVWPTGYRPPTIIINCIPTPDPLTASSPTSTGSRNPSTQIVIPNAWLASPTGGVYLEMSYKPPLPSEQLKRIHALTERRWLGISGLEAMPEQAYTQFELWTGRKAPRMKMKEAMMKSFLEDEQHSPMFMGSA